QTWAHRVRMVKQVLKTAALISMTLTIAFFSYRCLLLKPLLWESGWCALKIVMCSPCDGKMTVSKQFWERLSREKIFEEKKLVPVARLQRLTMPHVNALKNEGKEISRQAIH